MRRTRTLWAGVFLLYFSLITIPAARAYVDPGTGSYVFQVVIGALLGAAVAVKVFWHRLVGFVTRKPAGAKSSGPEGPEVAPGPPDPE